MSAIIGFFNSALVYLGNDFFGKPTDVCGTEQMYSKFIENRIEGCADLWDGQDEPRFCDPRVWWSDNASHSPHRRRYTVRNPKERAHWKA